MPVNSMGRVDLIHECWRLSSQAGLDTLGPMPRPVLLLTALRAVERALAPAASRQHRFVLLSVCAAHREQRSVWAERQVRQTVSSRAPNGSATSRTCVKYCRRRQCTCQQRHSRGAHRLVVGVRMQHAVRGLPHFKRRQELSARSSAHTRQDM
jgi:hypothetical protein